MNNLKKAKLALLVGLLTGGTAAYAQGDEMSQNRSDRGAYNASEEGYTSNDAKEWTEEKSEQASEKWDEEKRDLQASAEEERRELKADAEEERRDLQARAGQNGENQHTVHFDFDSAELTDDAKNKLEQMVEDFKGKDGELSLTVTGHTDATGPEEYNKHLAEQRAKAVREFLEDTDLELSNIEIQAAGSDQMINDGETISARQENRRAEISAE